MKKPEPRIFPLSYFKRPFYLNGMSVYTSDHHLAATLLDVPMDDAKHLIRVLNGDKMHYIKGEYTYKDLYVRHKGIPIILVRGFGYLIGTGGRHLSSDTAAKIQDTFGEWMARKLGY